jgi:hypothetical protein
MCICTYFAVVGTTFRMGGPTPMKTKPMPAWLGRLYFALMALACLLLAASEMLRGRHWHL